LIHTLVEEATGTDQDRTNTLLRKSCEGRFEIAIGAGIHNSELQPKRAGRRLRNTTRIATLIVNPKPYRLSVTASPATYGTVSGGGTFAEGSSVTVTATPNGTHSFVNWTKNGKVVRTSASYMFTMPSANVTLTARFK
jgi:hypothetical protein